MKPLKEIDIVRILHPVDTEIWGENEGQKITLPAGTEGIIVLVYGPPENPSAYEVEFSTGSIYSTALATIKPNNLALVESYSPS